MKYPKASRRIRQWLELVPDARVIYVFRPREEAVQRQLDEWWKGRPLRWLVRWIYRWQWTRGYLAIADLPAPVWVTTLAALRADRDLKLPKEFVDHLVSDAREGGEIA